MKVLTIEEGEKLLAKLGFPNSHEMTRAADRPQNCDFLLPPDSLRKSFLATCVADMLVADRRSALAYVFDQDVFEYAESDFLFAKFRLAFGESRSMYDAPFHLFEPGEVAELQAVMAMCMYFVWSVAVVSLDGERLCNISHDEYLNFYARDEAGKVAAAELNKQFLKVT